MKVLTTCAVALILGVQLPVQAHTAVQKRIEGNLANFYGSVNCHEEAFVNYTKMISCDFNARGHTDAISVYCEDTNEAVPYVDSEGKQKFGSQLISAFTVRYFSYHYGSPRDGVLFERGPSSPWAAECRRIYPGLSY